MINKGFFVPKRMADKLIDIINKATQERRVNLGLFLNKYVLWWYDDREGRWNCNLDVQISLLRKIYRNPQYIKGILTDFGIRGKKFREKIREDEELSIPLSILPLEYFSLYKKRMNYLFDTLEQMGYYIEYLPNRQSGLPLDWRLTINLGVTSVYETNLLLHRNYSIPYIPGSAVKGVTRHWAILKFAENSKIDPKKIDSALSQGKDLKLKVNNISFEDLINIFGSQNKKGHVIFFDALPITEEKNNKGKVIITLDVMNVHYKPYYEKGETPGDWYSPIPIFFLVIEKGTKFRFVLASEDEELVKKAKMLLIEALRCAGIGAKTNVGYGYFRM